MSCPFDDILPTPSLIFTMFVLALKRVVKPWSYFMATVIFDLCKTRTFTFYTYRRYRNISRIALVKTLPIEHEITNFQMNPITCQSIGNFWKSYKPKNFWLWSDWLKYSVKDFRPLCIVHDRGHFLLGILSKFWGTFGGRILWQVLFIISGLVMLDSVCNLHGGRAVEAAGSFNLLHLLLCNIWSSTLDLLSRNNRYFDSNTKKVATGSDFNILELGEGQKHLA